LDRVEAISILKELVARNLVEPSFVSVDRRTLGRYQLKLKGNYYEVDILLFARDNGLVIEADKDQKYLVIYKPH
jgi:hypothetical protein